MVQTKTQILTAEKIFRILKRITVHLYENNLEAESLVIVGVHDQGYKMAEYIQGELKGIDKSFSTTLVELKLDKKKPEGDITVNVDLSDLAGKTVVLVDDVLNTSRTLAYALKYLLQVPIKKLETAVLINRSHASFPISATYSGYELATALDEHIEVSLEGEIGAFLY